MTQEIGLRSSRSNACRPADPPALEVAWIVLSPTLEWNTYSDERSDGVVWRA
jgi:hypothetical protein